MSNINLNYSDLALPEDVGEILQSDFWILNSLSHVWLDSVKEEVKFTSSVLVFVASGKANVEFNLISETLVAPAIVTIRAGDVIKIKEVSEDCNASFIVMSEKMTDSLRRDLHTSAAYPLNVKSIIPIEEEDVPCFVNFFTTLDQLSKQKNNPFLSQAIKSRMLAFYFAFSYRYYLSPADTKEKSISQEIKSQTDRFLSLVRLHFRDERQVPFYAKEMGVTPKHLSRVLKQRTGYSAADWIRNYVLLESKVLLKSSALSIGQIAAHLKFPSQSFFAKFFKKATGISPKQYRNTMLG